MVRMNWSKLDEYIRDKMVKEHIAGVAVGISENGHTTYLKGFGFRDIEAELPATPETIFGIASVTKSFTALAIIDLERQGFLSVNDAVTDYLPELKFKSASDMESIKIHHLLTHSTGVPPMGRREDLTDFQDHIRYLNKEEFSFLGKPGEYFSYCNDTFLLLGAIIEKITGQSYRKYMTKHYLESFGMERSTYSLEKLDKMVNVSVPYNFNQNNKQLEKVDWPPLGNYEVGGGIRSNVVDLLRYGQLYVSKERAYTEKMRGKFIRVGRDSFYGYALNVTSNYANQYTIIQHGGGQPGVSSNFGFVPENKMVITVLTNVGGVGAGDIWIAAVNTALGLPIDYKHRIEPEFEMSTEFLTKFEGVYTSNEGGNIRILIEADKPYAEIDGQLFELRSSAADTLVLCKGDKPLRFYFDSQEKPWALFNGSRILRRKLV
jgi:CubicO group peptidase (beta-lactamase class C family)